MDEENIIVRSISLSGNTAFTEDEIVTALGIAPGQVCTGEELLQGKAAVENLYRNSGYVLAHVVTHFDQTTGIFHLKLCEGTVSGVRFYSLCHFVPESILGQMHMRAGAAYNSTLVKRDMQHIQHLGDSEFFEHVSGKPELSKKQGHVDLEITFHEKEWIRALPEDLQIDAELGVEGVFDYLPAPSQFAVSVVDPEKRIGLFEQVSHVLNVHGRHEQARQFLQIAISISRKAGLQESELGILLSIAETWKEQGNYAAAAVAIEEALGIAERVTGLAEQAVVCAMMGTVCQFLGRFEDAAAYYHRASDTFRAGADQEPTGTAINSLIYGFGLNEFPSPDDNDAPWWRFPLALLAYLCQGEYFTSDPLRLAGLLFCEGQANEAAAAQSEGEDEARLISRARRCYEEAVDSVENLRLYFGPLANLTSGPSPIESEIPVIYSAAVRLLAKVGDTEAALQYLQRMQGAQMLQEDLLFDTPQVGADVQRLLDQYGELEDKAQHIRSLGVAQQTGQRAAADSLNANAIELAATTSEMHGVWTAINQVDPVAAQRVRVGPGRFPLLASDLGDGIVLVSYLPLDSQLLIFTTDRTHGTRLSTVNVGRAELEHRTLVVREEMGSFQQRVYSSGQRAEVGWRLRAALYWLRRYLVEPIEHCLEGADNLLLIPNGGLSYLPFAALAKQGPENETRYLLEDYAIGYLHETTPDQWKATEKNLPPDWMLVAYGNPRGDLPGAEREVAAISRVVPPDHRIVYLRQEAKHDLMQDLPANATFLHFASHAALAPDNPNRNTIQFSNTDLTQREVYGLDLRSRGTRLVVLSACSTFPGQNNPGVEVFGLTDAFLKAGARTVVSTLWAVDDESTAACMELFYGRLLDVADKNNVSESLRQAQLSLLSEPKYSHPFFWAPFVAHGDCR